MKRYAIFLPAVLGTILLLMTGCQGQTEVYKGKILPQRIENIPDKDIIPEGAEGIGEREYDAEAFNPRMFIGRWVLQETNGNADDLEVPAPAGSGTDTWHVKPFPLGMVFGSAVRGGDVEVYRIPFDDVTYMQADYELSAQNEESESEGSSVSAARETGQMCFRMLYDTVDTRLAVGFTGEVTDEIYYNETVDSVDVCEVDYDFSWSGHELTLKFGGASATYVPSTFEGDMSSAVKGFSGGNGQVKIPGWSFSPLLMNGDGSGEVSTYYDSNVPMKYEFSEDGKFSVVTEYGEEFTYDKYWYSDSCLTLPSGDIKMMYQHDYLVLFGSDTYRYKSVDSVTFGNELTVAGKKQGSPLWRTVRDLIDTGYRTNADLDLSRIPSGSISPEFELRFRTARLLVRAFNPTDTELPLGGCIICLYRFDDNSGSAARRLNYLIGDDYAVCGETSREELQEFKNLYLIDDNTMVVQLSHIGSLSDYNFSDYSARVLDGMSGENATELLTFEMKEDKLCAVTACIADYVTGNLEHNVEYDKLSDLSRTQIEETAGQRDEIVGKIEKAFASQPKIACDKYGTIFVPWSEVFQYGKNELSDEGKEYIDEIIDAYAGALMPCDNIAAIETGVYARNDLIEDGQSFTVTRAEILGEYLRSGTSKSRRKNGNLPEISSVGYGSADYLKGENRGNLISVRFIMRPEAVSDRNEDVDLVFKADEGQDTFDYMKLSAEDVGKKMAAFAEKYSGEYLDDRYVNDGIGMDWQLPEGWHFYNDDELTSYNGGSAKEILLKEEPIYAFAAVNDSYDTMIDLRLYSYEGESYEEAASEFAESLCRSYASYCETAYTDVEVETEDVTIGERSVKKGTFRFTADEQNFVRKQYYLVFLDACAVITLSGTTDNDVLDDPGLSGSVGGGSHVVIRDKESLGISSNATAEYGVPSHTDIYRK